MEVLILCFYHFMEVGSVHGDGAASLAVVSADTSEFCKSLTKSALITLYL
jgi:hypothetical protein